MKDKIEQYIISQFGVDKLEEVLRENRLHLLYIDEAHNTKYLLNKANTILLERELLNVCRMFEGENIPYITFKGVVLANRLYKDKYRRFFGDIDIYVSPEHYEEALGVLFNGGYSLRTQDSLQNAHHVVLTKGTIALELHRRILNPFTKIDETYMYNHTEGMQLSGQMIKTLDVTATILHLIYHLYMDTWLKPTDLHSLLTMNGVAKANRFLFRAYEIVLFSQKYFNEIKWDEIINDISNQQLRLIFKQMIIDVLEIFPNSFPQPFLNAINNFHYVDDEKIIFTRHTVKMNVLAPDVNSVLSDLIDTQWENNVKTNVIIRSNGEFVLTNAIPRDIVEKEDYEFTCRTRVEIKGNDVKLTFDISNDDFCFSEKEDYNTQCSDGVHLIICGTEKYSYNSIFLFPKIINGNPIVVPVSVLNGENREINNGFIQTAYDVTATGYVITAVLKESFLLENKLMNYFYLGLVISNCSSKTKKRKSDLILSNPHSEWFNPIHFAKIEL